ncbi:MAG: geranyl-CoA carboxylase alpha subunit [Chloroflexota bacterium]|nr:geranyl-CoA carboxylase alpha subunit [Chloroflexota bacterium]
MAEELTPSQAAKRIGATTRSVQRWIASGRLPARRVGGRWHVATDAIDALVEEVGGAGAVRISPIRTLFIANRGEIASRITRTCERLGIRAVVPSTDGPDGLDLLDIAAVIQAARAANADALHPGFGFLAENADFAEAVIAAGIRWVGPPPDAIRAMGDKAAARRLAASLGVPVLPGYDDADQSDRALVAAGKSVGYPLLVKPAAGGGGKGMRTVRGAEGLPDAIAAARREAAAAFGDDRLILEHLVVGARHVEIQVLFDAHGNGIELGERDCSIQRRHQKVLEETPSPAVDAVLRQQLGKWALTLARAVGYVSAGTCEFLLDGRGRATFLEMNTRLQVEHPVTEMVTGRDLVADQLSIAAGEPLDVDDAAPVPGGHAVEVRLYAEDPEHGFLPATGRVEALRWPRGDGIRVDAGIAVGSEVGGRFDPMLAKIIAWGPDRPAAFERLRRALDETVVLGLVTNLRFLRWLVRQPVVLEGEARTDLLHRIWPPDHWAERTAIPDEAWTEAAAALLDGNGATDAGDPWAGGWRLNAPRSARLESDGAMRSVAVGRGVADPAVAHAAVRAGDVVHLDLAGRSVPFRLAPAPDVDAAARAAATHGAAGTTGPADVIAPMPGAVLTVHVTVGQAVAAGDPIVTLEAMKMEHVVAATIAGRVGDVRVRPADQVTRGQLLAVVEP